jgi:hypothetical protein
VSAAAGASGLDGYELVSSTGKHLGLVVATSGDYLVVTLGRLRKSFHPLPVEFVHADDRKRQVVVTVPKRALERSPRVDQLGQVGQGAVDAYYGLHSGESSAPAPATGRSRRGGRATRAVSEWLLRPLAQRLVAAGRLSSMAGSISPVGDGDEDCRSAEQGATAADQCPFKGEWRMPTIRERNGYDRRESKFGPE